MPEKIETPENFHQVAKERTALRRWIRESGEGTPEALISELEDLNAKARKFSELRKRDSKAAEELLKGQKAVYEKSAGWLDEDSIREQIGPTYDLLSRTYAAIGGADDFEVDSLRRGMHNADIKRINERTIPKIRANKSQLEKTILDVDKDNPTESRAFDLIEYNKSLHREGHIAPVDSVKKYLKEIGRRMIAGKPMFLHGPTGTGKTSVARFAAEHFTGKRPEMVYCNPQTRESNVWGKQGIRPAEGEAGRHGAIETVDIYGPLARAMRDGTVVVFDEFTALPEEQMVFLKGIFNAKVGDTVNIMGNGLVKIAPGFQMVFTANLKSEKSPKRQELPPEIAREFEQNNLEIGYTPPDESYDIMLGRLMESGGSVTLSDHDLNETLPTLCRAMAEIQLAYNDKESDSMARLTQTMDAGGKKAGLKKLVMTQGSVEDILEAWKIEKQINSSTASFTEFLDQCLKTGLTFKEYPETDRLLAAKILASMGFLRTVTPQELGFAANTFDFDAAKKLREDPKAISELKAKSAKERKVPLMELARLDPFRKKQTQAAAEAEDLIPENERNTPPPVPESAPTDIGRFLKETYDKWLPGTQANRQGLLDKAGTKPESVRPQSIKWQERSADVDDAKFGEYTINPDTAGINWESVPKEKIKIFPFADFVGKKRWELADYIVNRWPDRNKYIIPGADYWKFIIQHPDKTPDSLKDTSVWNYFFGSIFRNSNGYWMAPVAGWNGSKFYRHGRWLGNGWDANGRVVLLEK